MSELSKYIDIVSRREDLTEEQSSRAFQIMMLGGATPAQMGAFLIGLRTKGESVAEITGAVRTVRAKSIKIKSPKGAIDTCGTGGDMSGSLNISTAVAFVVSACGVPVAKHGNKAISSRSGSADVLSHLGVNVEAKAELMENALKEHGICFMMAPKFHESMRHIAPIRRELGVRTIFNILGPLSNPASTKYQLIGVFSKDLLKPMAEVLNNLGTKRAWIVHGSDGMDEITTSGITYAVELKEGKIRRFKIDPTKFGIEEPKQNALQGRDARYNASELKNLLTGKGSQAYRDIVILNSAAALVVSGKQPNLKKGIIAATDAIDNGLANQMLLKLVEESNLWHGQDLLNGTN